MIWPFRRKKSKPSPPPRPAGFPPGYSPEGGGSDVFDPALRHYARGFVKGEPPFTDAASERAYRAARKTVFDRCLGALASSPLSEQIVLRGSATLELWFGERARGAKDIDLVVRDPALLPETAPARRLLAALTEAISGELGRCDVDFNDRGVSLDSIWTYERAEGRRLVFPWVWQHAVHSQIQVDVVFCEPLQEAPIAQELGPGRLWFASRAESLAWKLLWLSSDAFPQGKDLYDAVLLAEITPVSTQLLRAVFDAKRAPWGHLLGVEHWVNEWEVDWGNFARDYPALAVGTVHDWKERLIAALRPLEQG